MPDKRWKAHERDVAKYFGTKRVPLSGINSGHNTHSDSLDPRLYIECKLKADLPILKQYKRVKEDAKFYDLTPVLRIEYNNAISAQLGLYVFHSDHIDEMSLSIAKLVKQIAPKRNAMMTLFDDTAAKAKDEDKIPLLAVKERKMQGFMIVCRCIDLQTINHIRRERLFENVPTE